MKKQILCAILVAASAVGCSSIGGKGGTAENQGVLSSRHVSGVAVNALPQAVKDSLRQQVPTAQISSIDKDTLNGKTVYKITFTDRARFPEMTVAEDGTVVQSSAK